MSGLAAVVPQLTEKIATYTATDLVTILAAVGVLVSSIVAGVVTIIATLRNGQQTQRLASAVAGDDTHPGLIGQVKEIHTLTNANMTAANNKIDKQTAEIQSLQTMIQDLKSERDKKDLATATAKEAPGAKPAEPTINMDVKNMQVEELNVPEKEKKE